MTEAPAVEAAEDAETTGVTPGEEPAEQPGEEPADETAAESESESETAPAPESAVGRELKLVVVLRPSDNGYLAQLAVGSKDCDPQLRTAEVTGVAAALDALATLTEEAAARWQDHPRNPALPPAPRPPAATRTRAARPPAAPAAPPAPGAPPQPTAQPGAPTQAQPSLRLTRQVGPDGKVTFVKAPPAEQAALF